MEDLTQLMGDVLIQANEMWRTLELDKEFKQNIDWTKVALSLFIAKARK
jgi:hypothetical protein